MVNFCPDSLLAAPDGLEQLRGSGQLPGSDEKNSLQNFLVGRGTEVVSWSKQRPQGQGQGYNTKAKATTPKAKATTFKAKAKA